RHEEALTYFDRALVLQPRALTALCNRARALLALGRTDEAMRTIERALAVDPTHADAHHVRANILSDLGRSDEALAGYAQSLALAPDRADIHLDEALALLRVGDFRAGWPKYEWRWRKSGTQFSLPPWDGQADLRGKVILLHAEQGHGDTLQFVRYAAMVAERGARVVLEVQPALKTLMMPLAESVIVQGEQRPPVDLHCP